MAEVIEFEGLEITVQPLSFLIEYKKKLGRRVDLEDLCELWSNLNMQKLFVYGTLKDPKIQRQVFGRVAKSSSDILPNFFRTKIKIEKMFPAIVPKRSRFVRGLTLSVNPKELGLIDKYESSLL